MKKPKILFFDIETSQIIMGAFDLKPRWGNHQDIIEDYFMICAAWKWEGDSKIYDACVPANNITNDKRVVKKLAEAISKSDIVVGHNIDKFDVKKFNTRLIYHKLDPISMPQTVDTLKVAKKEFSFTSNKLDYITNFLGVGGKTDNTRGLWRLITLRDSSALKEMLRYNRNDVRIQQRAYNRMKGFITNHPNMNVILESTTLVCKNCGSKKLIKHGVKLTKTGKYQKYQCSDCGAITRSKTAIQTFDGR